MELGIARFPLLRTLRGFDFSGQPTVVPAQIRELACGRWNANGEASLLGPPDVGKSLLLGTGLEEVKRGLPFLPTGHPALRARQLAVASHWAVSEGGGGVRWRRYRH